MVRTDRAGRRDLPASFSPPLGGRGERLAGGGFSRCTAKGDAGPLLKERKRAFPALRYFAHTRRISGCYLSGGSWLYLPGKPSLWGRQRGILSPLRLAERRMQQCRQEQKSANLFATLPHVFTMLQSSLWERPHPAGVCFSGNELRNSFLRFIDRSAGNAFLQSRLKDFFAGYLISAIQHFLDELLGLIGFCIPKGVAAGE